MTSADTSQATTRTWPRVRAVLLALTISVALVDGCPIPTERVMQHLSPALRTASLRLYDVQAVLLAPFGPIKRTFRLNQRWALFSYTGPLRNRMWIEARRHGEPWTLLYRPQDDAHRFLADTLEYRHVRNVWNPNRRGLKPSYPAFTLWIARRTFEQNPTFDEVRVKMERVTVLDHGKGVLASGEFEHEVVHRRDQVFP